MDKQKFCKGRRRIVTVALPEIEDSLFVRSLTFAEALGHEVSVESIDDNDELLARKMQVCVCDESGEPALTLEEAREAVTSQPFQVIAKVKKAIDSLNSLSAEAAETTRGNSQSSPSAAS